MSEMSLLYRPSPAQAMVEALGTALLLARPAHHDLGGLDDGQGRLAALELQLVHGVPGDDGRQPLVTDPEPHLRQQAVHADLLHDALELIPAAQGHQGGPATGPPAHRRRLPLCAQEATHLGLWNAVMAAVRARRAHGALVDLLLEGGVVHAEARRSCADGHGWHARNDTTGVDT